MVKYSISSYGVYTVNILKQGKSEGFDSCDQPSNLTKPWNLMDDLDKQ